MKFFVLYLIVLFSMDSFSQDEKNFYTQFKDSKATEALTSNHTSNYTPSLLTTSLTTALGVGCSGGIEVAELTSQNTCARFKGKTEPFGSASFYSFSVMEEANKNNLNELYEVGTQLSSGEVLTRDTAAFHNWFYKIKEFKSNKACNDCFPDLTEKSKRKQKQYENYKTKVKNFVLEKVRRKKLKNILENYSSHFERISYYDFLYPDSLPKNDSATCKKSFKKILRRNSCNLKPKVVNSLISESLDEIGLNNVMSLSDVDGSMGFAGTYLRRFNNTDIKIYDGSNKAMCEKAVGFSKYFSLSEVASKYWKSENPKKEERRKGFLNSMARKNNPKSNKYCESKENIKNPITFLVDDSFDHIVKDLLERDGRDICDVDSASIVTKSFLCSNEGDAGYLLSLSDRTELENSVFSGNDAGAEVRRAKLRHTLFDLVSKNLHGDPELTMILSNKKNFCSIYTNPNSDIEFSKAVADLHEHEMKSKFKTYTNDYCDNFERELDNSLCGTEMQGLDISEGDYIEAFTQLEGSELATDEHFKNIKDRLGCEMQFNIKHKPDSMSLQYDRSGLSQSKQLEKMLNEDKENINLDDVLSLKMIGNLEKVCNDEIQTKNEALASCVIHNSTETKNVSLDDLTQSDIINFKKNINDGDTDNTVVVSDNSLEARPKFFSRFRREKKDLDKTDVVSFDNEKKQDYQTEKNSDQSFVKQTIFSPEQDYFNSRSPASSYPVKNIVSSASPRIDYSYENKIEEILGAGEVTNKEKRELIKAVKDNEIPKDEVVSLLKSMIEKSDKQNAELRDKISALEKKIKDKEKVEVKVQTTEKEDSIVEGQNVSKLFSNKDYSYSSEHDKFIANEVARNLPAIQPNFSTENELSRPSQVPSFANYENTRINEITTKFPENREDAKLSNNINSLYLSQAPPNKTDWSDADVSSYVEFVRERANVGLIVTFDEYGKPRGIKVPWSQDDVQIDKLPDNLKNEILAITKERVVDMESDSYALYTMSTFEMSLSEFMKKTDKEESSYKNLLATIQSIK